MCSILSRFQTRDHSFTNLRSFCNLANIETEPIIYIHNNLCAKNTQHGYCPFFILHFRKGEENKQIKHEQLKKIMKKKKCMENNKGNHNKTIFFFLKKYARLDKCYVVSRDHTFTFFSLS